MEKATRKYADRTRLRHVLETHRGELLAAVRRRVARIRDTGSDATLVRELEDGDPWALDVQLAEIATAALRRVEAALDRLRDGQYGRCRRCRGEISEHRLRALPFAVCCQKCEAVRERENGEMRPARRRIWAEGYVALDHS
jgi:DnaK suppressor protein